MAFSIGALAAGGLLLLVWCGRPTAPERDEAAVSSREGFDVAERHAPLAEPEDARRGVALRSSPEPRSLKLRIVGPQSQAVAGATVSWSPLRAAPHATDLLWPWVRWEHLEAGSLLVQANDLGQAEFEAVPASSELGSVLWVTHPEWEPRNFVLAGQESFSSIPDPLVLQPTGGLSVLVLGQGGQPAEGAVLHALCELTPVEAAGLEPQELAARKSLLRTATTDKVGRARLPSLPGRMLVACEHLTLRTAPWRGSAPASVTFTLVPCFSVSGRAIPDSPDVHLDGCTLTVLGTTPAARKTLVRAEARADGTFGPLDVPLLPAPEALEYVFELAGERIVPTQVRRPQPAPGDVLGIEIPARRGLRFPVRVVEASGEPIRAAEVEYVWSHGGDWQRAYRATDASGQAELRAAPPGPIWLRTSAKGFLERLEQLVIEEEGPPWVVTLDRGGVIQGRCTHEGKAVEEFTIVYWGRQPDAAVSFRVQGSRDGNYEILSAPLGSVSVFAYSDTLPRTAPVIVDVSADAPARADFDLASPRSGRGRVIDLVTGDPLREARIQAWVCNAIVRTLPWGLPHAVEADGRFVIAAFGQGEICLEVTAPGYGARIIRQHSLSDGDIDFGVIGMAPSFELSIELVTEGERRPESYLRELSGPRHVPPTLLPPGGRELLSDLPAGAYRIDLERVGDRLWTLYRRLGMSAHETLRVVDRRVRELTVEVVPTPDRPLPPGSQLVAAFLEPPDNRYSLLTIPIPDTRVVDMGAVPVDSAVFTVHAPAGQPLATLPVPDLDRAGPILHIVLGAREGTIRVVDRERQPLSGATVKLFCAPGMWIRERVTDNRGEVRFLGLPADSFDVLVGHPTLGHGLFPDMEVGDDPRELILAGNAMLDVQLADGTTPLSGVYCVLRTDHVHPMWLSTMMSDGAGRGRFGPLMVQRHLLFVEEPGLWPTIVPVTASDPPVPTTVQVRRLGAARLRVRQAGLAVQGLELVVTSEEFGVAAAEWAAAGRVRVEPASLRTDQEGELRLEGLPRGAYRWSAAAEDGTASSGRFEVPPRARAEVEIALPLKSR